MIHTPKGLAAAVLAVLAAAPGIARAQDYSQGSTYVEKRGGVYGTSNDEARRMSAQGGAAGVYVADGLALEAEGLGYSTDPAAASTPDGRSVGQAGDPDAMGAGVGAKWHVLRGKKGSLHVGAQTGFLSDEDKALGGRSVNQTNTADMGLTLRMNDSVSLKAQGRYQNVGGLGAKSSTEATGGNVGIRVTF